VLKVVVGLGNPGAKYEKTRHNAGFVFLDHLASMYGVGWSLQSRFQGALAECVIGGQRLVLLKPQTFMNLSGVSVGGVLRYYKFQPSELLVIHDELDLPEGVIRLKRDGGHAGHNGLKDIISHIATRDFYRLRVGIGRPSAGSDVANYVLSRSSLPGYQVMLDEMDFVCNDFSLLMQADVSYFNGLMVNRSNKK